MYMYNFNNCIIFYYVMKWYAWVVIVRSGPRQLETLLISSPVDIYT